jgi:hypothetical protein
LIANRLVPLLVWKAVVIPVAKSEDGKTNHPDAFIQLLDIDACSKAAGRTLELRLLEHAGVPKQG